MRTILFVTGDESQEFIEALRIMGEYNVWHFSDYKDYEENIQRFKALPSGERRKPVLCLSNPPHKIKNAIYQDEMTFSIHASSLDVSNKNAYDIVFSGKLPYEEIRRVMKIMTQ